MSMHDVITFFVITELLFIFNTAIRLQQQSKQMLFIRAFRFAIRIDSILFYSVSQKNIGTSDSIVLVVGVCLSNHRSTDYSSWHSSKVNGITIGLQFYILWTGSLASHRRCSTSSSYLPGCGHWAVGLLGHPYFAREHAVGPTRPPARPPPPSHLLQGYGHVYCIGVSESNRTNRFESKLFVGESEMLYYL